MEITPEMYHYHVGEYRAIVLHEVPVPLNNVGEALAAR